MEFLIAVAVAVVFGAGGYFVGANNPAWAKSRVAELEQEIADLKKKILGKLDDLIE